MYSDRRDAGRQLAPHLAHLKGAGTVVLGLPRGGVPVAAEVATALGAPLDVILVRKLGVPFQPELAWGAIGEGGVRVINPDVLRMAHVSEPEMASVERRERASLEHRARLFRAGRPPRPLAGSTAVVVDDGLATGATAMAACEVARAHGATRVVLAVPVGPPTASAGSTTGSTRWCPWQPQGFAAIGQFYRDFRQVSDQEVVDLLARAAAAETGQTPAAGSRCFGDRPGACGAERRGGADPGRRRRAAGAPDDPDGARGVVLFAHGSGSRHSPRNRYVADVLHRAGLGTLLFDLLTAREEGDRAWSSTSTCCPAGWGTRPSGCASSPPPRASRSGSSGRARARPPRCGPPRTCRRRWPRSCHAEGGPTWPFRACTRCGRRPSWWWAGTTGSCST